MSASRFVLVGVCVLAQAAWLVAPEGLRAQEAEAPEAKLSRDEGQKFRVQPYEAQKAGLAEPQPAPPASPPRAPGMLAAEASALRDTVLGILRYARWPQDPPTVRLCLLDDSPRADALEGTWTAGPAERGVQARRLRPGEAPAAHCDALYIGAPVDVRWRDVRAGLRDAAVLTIGEQPLACSVGIMFCLGAADERGLRFEVNLDAVVRSGVKVHPQVLRLGQRSGEAQRP
jgi:hypothetical protein